MNSDTRGVAWDPNDVTRTTIKETNIHDNRTGNMQTTTNKKGTVLDTKDMKFKTTIRETIPPEEINLNMKVLEKLSVKDPNDVARTTIKETNIHDNRSGNIGGITKGAGYITTENEAPNTNRQFSSVHYTGIADGDVGGGGAGYLTNEKEAPNTNRQFSSTEYSGTAESMYKRPTTYSTAYNARTNEVREGTLVGRHPTPEGTKQFNGKDTLNVEIKKIQGDVINTRELMSSKVYNSIKHLDSCALTTDKNNYDMDMMEDRIKPDLLNAFRKNPYTQPLSSYAYN